jgi:hypothetical protein
MQAEWLRLIQMFARLGQAVLNFSLATGVGYWPVKPGGCQERMIEYSDGFSIAIFLKEKFTVEKIRVDSIRIDRKCLLQQFLGFFGIAETDRPAGHLLIHGAETGVGRTLECLGIDCDSGLKLFPGFLGQ